MSTDKKDPRTHAIIGAAMEVHRELGQGFLENIYQSALAVELGARGIPFSKEVAVPVRYKGHLLDSNFRADFVCFNTIIVELKALASVGNNEMAQVINYLKATGMEVGLLLNFGGPLLEFKRIILSNPKEHPQVDTGRRK